MSFILAGDESLNWHPLVENFIIVGKRVEELGFRCYTSRVTITEPMEHVIFAYLRQAQENTGQVLRAF